MALFDIGGDQEQADSATTATAPPTQGGMGLNMRDALPYIALQSLAAGAAGMSPNPATLIQTQQNAFGGLAQFQRMKMALGGQQGVADAMDRFAKGDLAGARASLRGNPLALLSPQGAALHGKLAEAEYGQNLNLTRNQAFADSLEQKAGSYGDAALAKQAREYAAFVRGQAGSLDSNKVVEEYGKRFVAPPVQVKGPGESSRFVNPWSGEPVGMSSPGVLKGPYGHVMFDPANPGAPGRLIPGLEEIPDMTADEKNGFAKLGRDPREAATMLSSPDPAVQAQGRQLRQQAFLSGATESSAKPNAEMGQAMSRQGDGQWANRPISEIPKDVLQRAYQQGVLDLQDKETLRKNADLAVSQGMRDSLPLWQAMPHLVGSRIADSKNGGSVPVEQSGLTLGQTRQPGGMADRRIIPVKEVPEYEHLLNARDQIANLRNDIRREIASGQAGGLGAGLTAKLRNLTGKENFEQVLAQINPALVGTARALQGGRASNQEITALQTAFQPRAIQTPAAMERALGQFQRIVDMSTARMEGRTITPESGTPAPYSTKIVNGQKYTQGADGTWRTAP